jgi:hypothetical protein
VDFIDYTVIFNQNYISAITIIFRLWLTIELLYMIIKMIYHLKDEGSISNKRVVITYLSSVIISILSFICSFFMPFKYLFLLVSWPTIPIILHRIHIIYNDTRRRNTYDMSDLLHDVGLIVPDLLLVILFFVVK